MDIATTRSAQEVQAAMVVARRFPRDEDLAYTKIMKACDRVIFAETSQYAYPRGTETVTGPSIRMAEALAKNWGNIDFGIVELDQSDGESQVMAYCWDLETNVRQTKIFAVRHERHTRSGVKQLTDPRDIYETVANNGSRRLRACILGIIPGDLVDAAIQRCNRTMKGDSDTPIGDRIRSMTEAFSRVGVDKDMLVNRLGHKLETSSETEMASMKKIFCSIRDGMSSVSQWFSDSESPADAMNKALEGGPDPSSSDPVDGTLNKSPIDHLARQLADKVGMALDKSRENLVAASRALSIDPDAMTDDQVADFAARIADGRIS